MTGMPASVYTVDAPGCGRPSVAKYARPCRSPSMPHPNRPNDEAWLEHNYCALTGGYVESPNGQLTDCYRSTLLPPVAWNPIEQNPVYAAAVLMLMIPRWREEGLHGRPGGPRSHSRWGERGKAAVFRMSVAVNFQNIRHLSSRLINWHQCSNVCTG